jgi:hypothetical protein
MRFEKFEICLMSDGSFIIYKVYLSIIPIRVENPTEIKRIKSLFGINPT